MEVLGIVLLLVCLVGSFAVAVWSDYKRCKAAVAKEDAQIEFFKAFKAFLERSLEE